MTIIDLEEIKNLTTFVPPSLRESCQKFLYEVLGRANNLDSAKYNGFDWKHFFSSLAIRCLNNPRDGYASFYSLSDNQNIKGGESERSRYISYARLLEVLYPDVITTEFKRSVADKNYKMSSTAMAVEKPETKPLGKISTTLPTTPRKHFWQKK